MLVDCCISRCKNYALICLEEVDGSIECMACLVVDPLPEIEINIEQTIYVLEPYGDCLKYKGAIITPNVGENMIKFKIVLKFYNRAWQPTIAEIFYDANANQTEVYDELHPKYGVSNIDC